MSPPPPLTNFWKIFLFILFRWLPRMTQIFFPNLVASTYVLLAGTIYRPLYKEFFILVVSNVSLWLFVVFSWLLFLFYFTRCMMKWRWHWLFLNIRFWFVLPFFNGKNFKWIPQWNSGIPLIVQFGFLVFTGSFNCYEIFCVVVSFMSIYLLNW